MTTEIVSAQRLRELLDYDPDTGLFARRVATGKGGRFKSGLEPGCVSPQGYRVIAIDRVLYKAHRLAWLHVHGVWPTNHIDHINGIKTDNRLVNLRDVSRSVNSQNRRDAMANNKTSGLLGAYPARTPSRWYAVISAHRHRTYLGMFDTPEEAHAAYLNAKRRLHPGCML